MDADLQFVAYGTERSRKMVMLLQAMRRAVWPLMLMGRKEGEDASALCVSELQVEVVW